MGRSSPEFDAMYDRLFSRWTDDAMTGLSLQERDFIIANVCINQSMNTGLMGYYEFSYGDRAAEAADVFDRIGVPQAASVLRRSNALMGPHGPGADQDTRGSQLEAL